VGSTARAQLNQARFSTYRHTGTLIPFKKHCMLLYVQCPGTDSIGRHSASSTSIKEAQRGSVIFQNINHRTSCMHWYYQRNACDNGMKALSVAKLFQLDSTRFYVTNKPQG
jgi:hypothetical protein